MVPIAPSFGASTALTTTTTSAGPSTVISAWSGRSVTGAAGDHLPKIAAKPSLPCATLISTTPTSSPTSPAAPSSSASAVVSGALVNGTSSLSSTSSTLPANNPTGPTVTATPRMSTSVQSVSSYRA
ncbi:unnamed protein product [Protopolystoma xenopodis]|uniref:Uncharacterized protein n=1 Tax=Protopolystoma xenopodis TaxID=117903 RepID=A0A448X0F6_9PLAT|nr:unnamed protein product [Protopolystoma xenopodis]